MNKFSIIFNQSYGNFFLSVGVGVVWWILQIFFFWKEGGILWKVDKGNQLFCK